MSTFTVCCSVARARRHTTETSNLFFCGNAHDENTSDEIRFINLVPLFLLTFTDQNDLPSVKESFLTEAPIAVSRPS